jgi:hypothetical protein
MSSAPDSYSMLESFRKPLVGGKAIGEWPEVPGVRSWVSGSRFKDPIPEPIVLYWDPEFEDAPAKVLYKAGIPMMKREMHKALLEAGVDNLDIYAVEVKSTVTPEVDRSFIAFNVVGMVSAADMSKSKYDTGGGPPLVAVDFFSVTLDPAKAYGARLFRLAENVSAIVVHDSVKRHLETRGFGLSFIPPEKWAG